MPPGLQITVPGPNGMIHSGVPFQVAGVALTRGNPEPIGIASVTVKVGNHAPVNATLQNQPQPSHSPFRPVAYHVQVTFVGGKGMPVPILVTATDSDNARAIRSVTAIVDQTTLDTMFTGTAILKTTFNKVFFGTPADARGPFFEPCSIGLQFSPDRATVTVTSLAIMPTTISPQAGTTVTITVAKSTQNGGGVGTFNLANSISMPISLDFHIVVATTILGHLMTIYDGISTLALNLMTGPESTGTFGDAGSPMLADGSVALAGDGMFTGGILAGSEASLVLMGTVAPHP